MHNKTINDSYNFNFKVPCSPAVSIRSVNSTNDTCAVCKSFEVNTYRPENIVDETSRSPWEELLVQ